MNTNLESGHLGLQAVPATQPTTQPDSASIFSASQPFLDTGFSREQSQSAPLEGVKFEGMEPEQMAWTANLVGSLGLPMDNVRTIRYAENEKGKETTVGSYAYALEILTLHKSLTDRKLFPEAQSLAQVQIGTVAHEIFHSLDPLIASAKPWEQIAGDSNSVKWVMARFDHQRTAVAEQALATGTYMSGYHKYHAKRVISARDQYQKTGSLEDARALRGAELVFKLETWAIMGEQRLKGEKALSIYDTSVKNAMEKRGINTSRFISAHDTSTHAYAFLRQTDAQEVTQFVADLKGQVAEIPDPTNSTLSN